MAGNIVPEQPGPKGPEQSTPKAPEVKPPEKPLGPMEVAMEKKIPNEATPDAIARSDELLGAVARETSQPAEQGSPGQRPDTVEQMYEAVYPGGTEPSPRASEGTVSGKDTVRDIYEAMYPGSATEKPEAAPEPKYTGRHSELYDKAAKAVMERTGGDLQVKGGDFMDVDGTRFVRADAIDRYNEIIQTPAGWYGGARELEAKIAPHGDINLPMEGMRYRNDLVGRYGVNNSIVQYVDRSGRMHVGYATEENMKALQGAGYERSGDFAVGLSVAESRFVNPTNEYGPQYYGREGAEQATEKLNKDYEAMLERGREKAKQERIARHVGEYRKVAEEKDIKPVAGGEFMTIDGVAFEWNGQQEPNMVVPLNTDGYNPSRRTEHVGTFNYNNGTYAFVDGDGRMNIGYGTSENRKALEDAGYKWNSNLGVPFSNGEVPTDERVRTQYTELQERGRLKAAEERKAAEQRAASESSAKPQS